MNAATTNYSAAETADLENALVATKNRILAMVNAARDAADLERCHEAVNLVMPMWAAVGYAYKGREILKRIGDAADLLHSGEQTYLDGCRKNDRTRATTLAEIGRLAELIKLRNV
jgi:hypothetical protein